MHRHPDGTFDVTFQQQTKVGKISESTETGFWSIKNNIYDKTFHYRNLKSKKEYSSQKVPDDYRLN